MDLDVDLTVAIAEWETSSFDALVVGVLALDTISIQVWLVQT